MAAPADTTASSSPEATDAQTEGSEAAEEPAGENLFPDLDVQRISDGATVNLASELGGGELPVLLWVLGPPLTHLPG